MARNGGADAVARLGDVQRLHEILRRRVCQDLEVGAEAFPANSRPGAFQEPQPADHVAEDRDDLRRAEAALAGCLVGLLVGREGVLELLQVDEAPCDLVRLVII